MLHKLLYKTHSVSVPFKDQLIDIMDKAGFAITFFIGTTGILFLKAVNASQAWVTLYPVTIMCLYAAIIYFNNRLRLAEEQAGDNLYYLGFLFTLISLSCALYQFNEDGSNSIIIENFGIALATTIVGLLLRILFNKMRHDPVEIEREARLELASTATRLRTDLLDVTKTMKTTLLAAQQQTREIIEDYENRFDTIQNSSLEKFSSVQNKSDDLVQIIEKLLSRINNIDTPHDLLEKKLAPAIESIKLAGDEILNRVRNDELSIKQLTKVVKNAINSSEFLDTKINILSDHSEKLNSVLNGLSELNTQISETSQNMNKVTTQTSEVTSHQAEASESLNQSAIKAGDNFNNLIELQNKALIAFEKALGETLDAAQNHNQQLADELKLSREYTRQVHSALVSLTESLANDIASDPNKVRNETIQ